MTCAWCLREIVERFDGPCRAVIDIDGLFKRCGLERNAAAVPLDPHRWDGGFDHIRDGRDPPLCACRHPQHSDICDPCASVAGTFLNAGHSYRPGIIDLDHEARE